MRKIANLELTMGPVLGHDGDQYDDVDQADDAGHVLASVILVELVILIVRTMLISDDRCQ